LYFEYSRETYLVLCRVFAVINRKNYFIFSRYGKLYRTFSVYLFNTASSAAPQINYGIFI
jgi:hypothetical protein